MNEQNNLEQMYRRFSQKADSLPLPTEEQLLTLIHQQPQTDAHASGIKGPLKPPVRRLRMHVWRYAASVLLVVSAALIAWLLSRQQPASMVADHQPPATTPSGISPEFDTTSTDTTVPVAKPFMSTDQALLASQPTNHQPAPSAADTSATDRLPLPVETHNNDLLSDESAPLIPNRTDSSALPHFTPDYNEHQLIKENDIRANENADPKTIQPKQQPSTNRRKRKINLDKNKKDDTKNDVNVIHQQSNHSPRPHIVPTSGGHHTTIWY